MKIAILYICTGYYSVFWKDFYLSFEKNFIPETEKHYFVFTDANSIYDEENNLRIHKIFQENFPWPYSTLKRYHIFLKHIDELEMYDYVFFMNANALCNQPITGEDILPRISNGEHLTVVQHPYSINRKLHHFTYDRNPLSTAYIPYSKGKYYICGGVNGGTSHAFCELISELYLNIEMDFKKGIIALWHDESHINKYILNRTDCRVLPPSFCYPEGSGLPFPSLIMVRDKSKWIPLGTIKHSHQSILSKPYKFIHKCVKHLTEDIAYFVEKLKK